MENSIQIGKRLIALEQIALVELYLPDANKPLQSKKAFQSRIVMIDKRSILSEEPVATFVSEHAFRTIAADGIATNPALTYWIECFEPDDTFRPDKPFQSRLLWRMPNGMAHSKLLLAAPETALAVAVRGLRDPGSDSGAQQSSPPRQRRAATQRRAQVARDPN